MLALHAAAVLGERCTAVLAVDTLGGTGDGGSAALEAEMARRTPEDVRRRALELDGRAMRGEGTEEDALESLSLVGAESPMPNTASSDTAARMPGAFVEVVPGAGHLPWFDAPWSVRAAWGRLLEE